MIGYVGVEGGARDAQQSADLAHRHTPLRVEFPRAGQALGILHGGGAWTSSLATTRACRSETRLGPLDDQRAFEFGECAEDVEDQPPSRRGGVDLLRQAAEPDAAAGWRAAAGR